MSVSPFDHPVLSGLLGDAELAALFSADAELDAMRVFEMALAEIGGDGGRVAMVGDRISSDIAGGRDAGLATVLVLSGTSDRAQAEAADPAPDHVVENLAALLR